LCLLTCKNRLPYNLYCVGGDVKPCSINQSTCCHLLIFSPEHRVWMALYSQIVLH